MPSRTWRRSIRRRALCAAHFNWTTRASRARSVASRSNHRQRKRGWRLKAAFVYQFPQFVDWPDEVWRDAPAVQLCVLQPNVFGSALDELAHFRGHVVFAGFHETGDLAQQAALLSRFSHQLIWLNPLLRFEGFAPRAA